MGRRNFNDGQEITFEDLNAISAAAERGLYDRFLKKLVQDKTDSFFGDGFKVSYATSTSVSVALGLGVQEDLTQDSPEPEQRPLYLPETLTLSTAAPHASLNRIDIVVCNNDFTDEISAARKFKDAIGGTVSLQTLVTQIDWLANVEIISGSADVSPVAPATPSGQIKIAELLVTAVTGMSGAGAVTDTRVLMPVAGEMLLDTLGYERLTAGAEEGLSTLMEDIDDLLKNGYFEYFDMDNLSVAPDAPGASKMRVYFKDGVAFFKDSSSVVTPLGSGGGGGGGLVWHPVDGSNPILTEENSNSVYLFDSAQTQQMAVWLKVPASYISGRQITMKIGVYTPATANNVLMQSVATLIRANNDAVSSTTNQRTSTNTQLTNTVANRFREVSLDLTSATGTINSVAVSAGDLIKVVLSRAYASESVSDSNDTRFIPTATEVSFA